MMKEMINRRFFLYALLLLGASPFNAAFSASYNVVSENDTFSLEICENKACIRETLPKFDFEKPSYDLHDIDGDGHPEVIVTETGFEGMVNICSILFRIDNKGKTREIKTNDNSQMCNITFHGGKVISSYRDSASWYDVVYRYSEGKLFKELEDKNEETRTIFNKNGEIVDRYMIKNGNRKWFEREKQYVNVVSPRAYLYNSANHKDASKMYLVNGDIVLLKDFEYSNDIKSILFYKIEFVTPTKKRIIKWIKSSDIQIAE